MDNHQYEKYLERAELSSLSVDIIVEEGAVLYSWSEYTATMWALFHDMDGRDPGA